MECNIFCEERIFFFGSVNIPFWQWNGLMGKGNFVLICGMYEGFDIGRWVAVVWEEELQQRTKKQREEITTGGFISMC